MFNKIMEFLITNDFTPSFVLNKKYQHSKAKKDLKFPEFETVNSGIYIRKFIYYKQKKIYFVEKILLLVIFKLNSKLKGGLF